ncbi:hypothetical protein K7862_34915 [Streptomyces sp. PLK6-54]|uniref:Integral membrane protein n=1 Tax=Actinacidiphila acidipaludis TaxID=2873382 RepID=A0ABS7QI11_9ACTN|nr:hypothetical protein [Streptomyces acidipaludis]
MDAAVGEAIDDDALLVLTAALLTPGQYPGVLGDDYPSACAGLGLEPVEDGYGLVFGQDGTGARWTVATTDAWMVACALAAWDCGLEYDLSPDESSMIASLPGWPVPVAVSVPGIPAPFDPDEETAGGPALTPPDPAQWGPAQRRLGADEIAIHWREWRDQFDAAGDEEAADAPADTAAPDQQAAASEEDPAREQPGPGGAADPGGTAGRSAETGRSTETGGSTAESDESTAESGGGDDAGTAREDDAVPAAQGPVSHSGVRRVLEAAEAYVRTPPPPGRVRLAYGSVRADGPGWSLVGRADDMAFALLDDVPGEILPIGRGPSLPVLMEALGRLASAPATAAASS